MGGDKAAIEFDGMTLIERSIGVLSEVFSAVAVSGGSDTFGSVLSVADRTKGMGPLGGLDSVYQVAEGRSIFLLAVDMPFVDPATVHAIGEPELAPLSARVPFADGRRQPLCALYGGGLGLIVAESLTGEDRSLSRLLGLIHVEEVAGLDGDVFINVNTVEDLDAAIKRSDQRRNTR